MPQLITFGSDLIRINPAKNSIERSPNKGVSWMARYTGSSCGTFRDLIVKDGELYACTSKGVFRSPNGGISWLAKNTGDVARNFTSIQDSGKEMLATTADGHLYFSPNNGISWMKRR